MILSVFCIIWVMTFIPSSPTPSLSLLPVDNHSEIAERSSTRDGACLGQYDPSVRTYVLTCNVYTMHYVLIMTGGLELSPLFSSALLSFNLFSSPLSTCLISPLITSLHSSTLFSSPFLFSPRLFSSLLFIAVQ
jgi:hypothetical protein